MYLIDNNELEALTFVPGVCTECGNTDHVYHDGPVALCLDCLEDACREEVAAVNAQEWDGLYHLQAEQARQMANPPAFALYGSEPF